MSLAAKTIKTGWRAFSNAFQTDFGVPIAESPLTNFSSLNFEGVPSNVDVQDDWQNTDEVTGRIGPTIHQILTFIMSGEHNQKVSSHQVALLASMCLGAVQTTGLTPKTHTITPKTSDMLLGCRTMVESDGLALTKYTGVVCTDITIEGKRRDFIKMSAKLNGTGTSATSTMVSRPSMVSENYLSFANASVSVGGSTINSEIQDFKFGFKNNGTPIYEFNDVTRMVTRFERGALEATFECTIELLVATHFNNMVAGSDVAVVLTLSGGANNAIIITLPKCRVKKHTKDVDGEKLIAKLEFAVIDNLTTWVSIVVNNLQTQYA